MYCEIENFAYGKINERGFSNPHSWTIAGTMKYRVMMHRAIMRPDYTIPKVALSVNVRG